ncbi:MAG: alanine racemase [Deltaproteobacteria bacterium]|nr:alanine racemase [Deltaproteobacteria bacterium]MBW2043063.1 alanine racemase [Deltaproteobacteria bacterium]MBW2133452.1 alanine racemase [Deltaproteobacteria bacterium]
MMEDFPSLDIDTPALLIDLDVVERNLDRMQKKAESAGASLRPHVKAHKIPELARLQIQMGAKGITASKVSEAEVMADAGIDDIFIANQVVAEKKIRRLAALSRKTDISVGLDSRDGAKILSEMFSAEKETIDYLIEIDSGLARCGVKPGRPAVELFKSIEHLPSLRFRGIFTHAGQVYGSTNLGEVKAISRLESETMLRTERCFEDIHVHPDVVSVGSTPTMRVWEGCVSVNEIRPGNYIFLDAIQIALGVAKPQECALTVLATVTSRPASGRAVIDAGSKVFALDKGAHGKETTRGFGIVLGRKAVVDRLSEEHGILALDTDEKLKINQRVRIIPNHACTVINLFDKAYAIRRGRVDQELKIAARGTVQ